MMQTVVVISFHAVYAVFLNMRFLSNIPRRTANRIANGESETMIILKYIRELP